MATYIDSEVLDTTIESIIKEAADHITIFYPYEGVPGILYPNIIEKLKATDIKITLVFSQYSILENLPQLANELIARNSKNVEIRVINILYDCCVATEQKALVIHNLNEQSKGGNAIARLINKLDKKSPYAVDTLNYINGILEKSYLIYNSSNNFFNLQ